MRGALNNLNMYGSPLYVFTDAGPKDDGKRKANIAYIKEIAQRLDVTINFLTTGMRASSYEPGSPGWPGFRDLASPLNPL